MENKRRLFLIMGIMLTILFFSGLNVYAFTLEETYVDSRNKIEKLEIVNLSFSNNSSAKPSEDSQYSAYDYVIDKYDIDIIVNENNTFDITEKITAYFNVSKHGIFRTIPLKNKITRLDGTSSTNQAQISNLSVDNEYTTYRENGNYKIQIGSSSHTLKGEQTYVIKYTYNLGKDPVKDYDELYYNLIGSDWDTVIGNLTFTITMPKKFDSSKLGFSSGIVGSTDSSDVQYSVRENRISGSYNGILEEGRAITVRCELPEGYFVNTRLATNPNIYWMFVIPFIFLIISIVLWCKYGRDDKVVETMECYPPKGLNSLEVGFLYKGKANKQDVGSLLIYLANKGYLKISEKDSKITKLKEYDGKDINERKFLNGLFSKKHKVEIEDGKETVALRDLYNNFYITIDDILINMDHKKDKIFEKKTSNISKIVSFLLFISLLTIHAIPTMDYLGISGLKMSLFVCILCIIFAIVIFSDNLLLVILLVGFLLLPSFFFLLFHVLEPITTNTTYLCAYLFGLVCIVGMGICFRLMPKRTKYGNEILGKIRGFKNFLETVEKDKLEAMITQDPTYFYTILPYTYVLGTSDKWFRKFESITLKSPSWYDSSTLFDMCTFGETMNSTMTSAQNVMSSSSSDSSGGGSSDGGSGGGGGGSW